MLIKLYIYTILLYTKGAITRIYVIPLRVFIRDISKSLYPQDIGGLRYRNSPRLSPLTRPLDTPTRVTTSTPPRRVNCEPGTYQNGTGCVTCAVQMALGRGQGNEEQCHLLPTYALIFLSVINYLTIFILLLTFSYVVEYRAHNIIKVGGATTRIFYLNYMII